MSWTDPAVTKGEQRIRRAYYLRAVSTTVSKNFTINDQLPRGQLFRVSATGSISSTAVASLTEGASVIEVRLYNAFNTSRAYDTDVGGANAGFLGGSYIILGVCNFTLSSATVRSLNFTPAPPIECRGFNGGVWTIALFSCDLQALATAADIGAWSFQVDVRGGGPAVYLN